MDKDELSHEELRSLFEMAKQHKEEQLLKSSKEQLRGFLATRLKTVFIGALAAFEEEFGDVIEDDNDAWQRVRRKILNNGNNQIRLICQELDNNNIKRKKNIVNFRIDEGYDG